jgi:hypothetical protein
MKSIKCVQCGLVYWATDPNCKRCGLPTAEAALSALDSNRMAGQYAEPQPLPPTNFVDDAEKLRLLKRLRRGSIYFYFIGGLQILLWFVIGQLMIVDGVLNITLSFIAHKFRSRVASLLLLGLTLLAIMSLIAMAASGTRAIVPMSPIGIILRLLVCGRMVQATFRLKAFADDEQAKVLPPPPPNFYPDPAQQWAPAGSLGSN